MEGKPGNDPDDTTNPYISIDYTYNADGIRTKKEVTTYSLQDVGTKSGIYLCSDGEIRYFTNGELTSSGLIKDENDNYYYIRSSLVAVRGQEYWVTNTNDLIAEGSYYFAPDGRMVVDLGHGDDGTLFSGLRTDADGETRYYMNGVPTYAGLMLINGDYYYFNSTKKAVRNCTYTVTKHNDLLPEGDYVFDEDGKMVLENAAVALASTTSYQVWAPSTTTTYNYIYNGSKLTQMSVGNNLLTFSYDASGTPMAVQYNGTTYYYVTNIQGDVIAIVDNTGTAVVEYTYDAWGNPLTTTVADDAPQAVHTLSTLNPLRYRGYVYDSETQYYYLQSRYYDPEVGRFLNADALAATGQGVLGNNMFAYCNNGPSNMSDSSGNRPVSELERNGDASLPVPPRKRYEKKVFYSVTLFSQGKSRLCWAYCQVMEGNARLGYNFTQEQADECAGFIARVVNGELNWNHGAFPTNAGDRYYINSIEDLYDLLKNNGPLYALYVDKNPGKNGVHSTHMVLVSGVNVTTNKVVTLNPWGKIGNQSFQEFLSGVAWDYPYSYDFELASVYTVRKDS